MKRVFSLLLICVFSVSIFAETEGSTVPNGTQPKPTSTNEQDSIKMMLAIVDGFSLEPIKTESISFKVIDKHNNDVKFSQQHFEWQDEGAFFLTLPKISPLTIKCSVPNYDDKYFDFKPSKLALKKSILHHQGIVELYPKTQFKILNEVTVTATTVKMVIKGDTIESIVR